jgi:hypothetical protein
MIHRPGNLGIGITAGLVCMPFNTDECVNVDPPCIALVVTTG